MDTSSAPPLLVLTTPQVLLPCILPSCPATSPTQLPLKALPRATIAVLGATNPSVATIPTVQYTKVASISPGALTGPIPQGADSAI